MSHPIKWAVPAVLALCSLAAQAANEVQSLRGHSVVSTRYGQSSQGVDFDVRVQNLGFAKQVFAHLKRWDGTWVDVPLQYKGVAGAGYEIWTANYAAGAQPPINTTYDLEYAVKYIVNGQTYWDNNGGQNYKVNRDTGNVLHSGLNIYSGIRASLTADASNNTSVGVTVKNLAFSKVVQVKYTSNNWTTTQTASCVFGGSNYWSGAYSSATNPNAYGFEEWYCPFNVGTATAVDYYFVYQVNGQTYYDSNFGSNYHANILH